jgi:hypothetical protein
MQVVAGSTEARRSDSGGPRCGLDDGLDRPLADSSMTSREVNAGAVP